MKQIPSSSFYLIVALALLLLPVGCTGGQEPAPTRIHVLAASSLTNAFSALAEQYEQEHPGVDVQLGLAASSQLATQIIEGAGAELFASADEAQMERVREAGLLAGPATRFASNELLLIFPAENPAGIEHLADLARPGVKVVTAAEEVPIGRYTRAALAAMEASGDFPPAFQRAVLANVVSEEANVRQVVTKVQLGEADAAIVYASDVRGSAGSSVGSLPIPAPYNIRASYLVAPLAGAANPEGARDFIAFLRSPEAAVVLQEWGFDHP